MEELLKKHPWLEKDKVFIVKDDAGYRWMTEPEYTAYVEHNYDYIYFHRCVTKWESNNDRTN